MSRDFVLKVIVVELAG